MIFFIQVIILLHANFVSLFQQPTDDGSFHNEMRTDTNRYFFDGNTYIIGYELQKIRSLKILLHKNQWRQNVK